MSALQWTEPQRAAIYDGGGALLVSAAAGSGKTAVLVQRALHLISRAQNPLSADRLLILTFTNAAAEELRGRIARQLEEMIAENPHNTALRRQRLLFGKSTIGTLDAFCLQLVREHFVQLDLPPDVNVGDTALLAQLAAGALDDTMEEMLQDADFSAFAALYGRARSDAHAESAVQALYSATRTLPWPRRYLQDFEAAYTQSAPLGETDWGRQLLKDAETALTAAGALSVRAGVLAGEDDALAAYREALDEEQAGVARLLAAVQAGEWDNAARLASVFSFARLPAARGAGEEARAAVKALREGVKKILGGIAKNILACTQDEFEADRRAAAPMVAALVRAVLRYEESYDNAKNEEHVLDFADFEHLALRLLCDEAGGRTPLADAVSARYGAVMVDEYQDTNALQDALYQSLAAPGGDNLFLVGDVKQSVYRFRSADPGLFLAKKHAWAAYNAKAYPAVIALGHNFRSAVPVIGGVNFVFGRLMSRALGEVDYTGDEALIAGPDNGAEGGLELCVLQGDAADEAAWLARRVAGMLAGGETVGEGGQARPCRPEDICVLLRVKKRAPQFLQALRRAGVPAVADLGDDMMQSPEVLPLAAALCAIDNPGDDISLAATLLGPLFSFTPDAVTALRARAPRGRLWAALAAGPSAEATAFLQEFEYYRTLATGVSAGQLCEELVGRTGYLAAVSAMPDGSVRRENLLRFIAWAGGVSAGGRGGLPAFVRLLQSGAGPEAPAVKTIPGHVSILTVHKSKGLEFPICFLADAAHGFNRRAQSERVLVHPKLGVGMDLRAGDSLYPTLPRLAVRGRQLAEGVSEEMRVLYVALTRAKKRMIACFAGQDTEKRWRRWALEGTSPALLARAGSFADWLVAAALRHAGSLPVWQRLGLTPPVFEAAEGPWHIEWIDGEAGAQQPEAAGEHGDAAHEGENAEPTANEMPLPGLPKADEALVANITAAFAQTPPRAALAAVPAKLSVSHLVKPDAPPLYKRPSFMYAGGLNAAERGTAQHSFLQFANLAAAKANPSAELARLVDEGYMLPAVAAAVDKKGVEAFLASPLAQRLFAAKKVLREYDFLTAIPARAVNGALGGKLADEPVLVQGIADYKTDRGVSAETLAARYRAQLQMYAAAIEKRLALPVKRCTLWSFALGGEVAVFT